MSDTDMIAAIVGFVLPLAASIVMQAAWPSVLKGVVTLVCCVLAGFATAYYTGSIDGMSVPRAILIVFFTAMGSYHTFWKPTQIAPKVEAATTM